MPALSLPTFPRSSSALPDDLRQQLGRVRHIVTDLDNTMVSHGTALANASSQPSFELPQTLVMLREAGIDVTPCSGRNRAMIREDARMLGLTSWIGEMGGVLCTHEGANATWEYFTAEMPYSPGHGMTPHDMIVGTGIVDRLLARWFDSLEPYNDNGVGYQYREVSVALRGAVVEDEAQAMLNETDLPLELVDNGLVTTITGPTILPTFEDGTVEDVHTYHLNPRGLDKGTALQRYIELRGWDPAEVMACGDSPADCTMAPYVGTFLIMSNGIGNPKVQAALATAGNAWVSSAPSVDGWCEAARTLVALR